MRHRAFTALSEMEEDVRDVSRWAGVLNHLAASDHQASQDEIWVICDALREVGNRLVVRWTQAHEAAKGQP
jgi:hypothetical protein